jgi:DNA-binding MarR family transcriptional regulator
MSSATPSPATPEAGHGGAVPSCSEVVPGAPRLPDVQERAWMGFLATHSELTRGLEAGLAERFGLSLSALEVLARVAWHPDGRLRMNDLACGALLSQSRVSRLVDQLAGRGLIERSACPSDSRGVYAHITDAGRELAGRALEFHFQEVRSRFVEPLEEEQLRLLGEVWEQLLGRCPGP